jgi:hypothetical protein
VRGQLVEERVHVLRLDREDQGVRVLRRLGVADGLDSVPLRQFSRAFRTAGGDQQVGR